MQAYEKLEAELQKWTGLPHLVACNSGSGALHLAFESLRLPLGSKVLLCDFNMIACARAISMAGLEPVFADCNSRLLLDLDYTDEMLAADDSIRAILAVHTYGRRCEMNALATLVNKYELYLVEDLAEAHGVAVHPRSDAAAYSFYMNKIITSGEEGGAVGFKSPDNAKVARSLRCQGFTDKHDFYHIPRGCNYRLANSLAEKILLSLARVEESLSKRREVEGFYDKYTPHDWKMPAREVVWIYDLRIPGLKVPLLDKLVSFLQEHQVSARHGFKALSMQQEYRAHNVSSRGGINPHALRASAEVLYLPVQEGITEIDCKKSLDLIKEFVKGI